MVDTGGRASTAWRGLGVIAGAFVVLLVALAGRYGYHRDELYFIAIGAHPDWGYVDQPALIPLLAHAMDAAFGHSLVMLRVPPALAGGGVVLVTGLICRELGGGRTAQLLAAACMAVSAVLLGSTHLATTTAFDLLVWTTLSWLLVRALRDGGRTWLLVGLVAGVGLEIKTLVVFLLFGMTVGLLAVGPRAAFRSVWPYVAAAIAVLLWLPDLIWQGANGWPQLDLSRAIASGESGTSDSPVTFLVLQLGLISPLLIPVWVSGWWRLLRSPQLSLWRSFAVTYPVLLVVFLLSGGKAYYMAGLYPVLLAAGAPAVVDAAQASRARRGRLGLALGLSLVIAAVLFLPVVPASSLHSTPIVDINYDAGETNGWPELARTVQTAYDDLDPAERAHAIVLGGNYGEAGAVLRFAPGVPTYSGHNSFWDLGPPPADVTTALALGFYKSDLEQWFDQVQQVATVQNDAGVDNDEDGMPVYVCRGLRRPWAQTWPELRQLG